MRRIIQGVFSLCQYNVKQFLLYSVQAKVVLFRQKIIQNALLLCVYAKRPPPYIKGQRPFADNSLLFKGIRCETVSYTVNGLYIAWLGRIWFDLFPQFMGGAIYGLGVLHLPCVLTYLPGS